MPKEGRSVMPHEASRGIFYSGVLAILTIVYTARAITWWASPTEGRIAGVDWVSGWMSTEVVASLWVVVAVACAVGAVATAKRCRKYRNLSIAIGIIAFVIPMLIALYFFGSTILWYWNLADGHPPPEVNRSWRDSGSPTGWVTGVEYLSWSLIAAWSLMVHTGTTTMIARMMRALRRALHHQEVTDA